MPRKGDVPKRRVLPDSKYNDRLITKFINALTIDGKKGVAEKICYRALEAIEQKINDDVLQHFRKAIDNVKPSVEVKSRRVGGSTYQVPVDVRPERRQSLALRWLIDAAHDRNEKTMAQRLSGEIMDAANERGSAFTKKINTHKMADANKAFAHYRW